MQAHSRMDETDFFWAKWVPMEYLSCDCEHCKNGIEFPAHGIGRRISCPHCGAPVTLKKGNAPAPPAPLPKLEAQPLRASVKPVSEIKPEVKQPAPIGFSPGSAGFEEKAK